MRSKKYKNARDSRLAKEYKKVEELCSRSSRITFKILHQTKSSRLPDKYEITFKLKSIVGIDKKTKMPEYSNLHKMRITLPPRWPAADSPPDYYINTDIWHPNIKSSDPYKGHVCINSKAISVFEGLDNLILRVAELLQWKNYLAEDKPPYPEDVNVAKWVRDFAEPKGIVNFKKGLAIDYSDLLEPIEDETIFEEPNDGEDDGIVIIIEDEKIKDIDIEIEFD